MLICLYEATKGVIFLSDLGNKKIMAENIIANMEKLGIDRAELAKSIDVPYPTVSDWINAKTYPRIDKIEKMAKLFYISKSDLIEKKIPIAIISDGLSDEEINLILKYRELTNGRKKFLSEQIQALLKLQ